MKKIINIDRTPILFDSETEKVKRIQREDRYIDGFFVVPEDAKLQWENYFGDSIDDRDVKKGDIIVTFYNARTGTDYAVVKSEDWLNAINKYNKSLQDEKEDWANSKCENCESI